MNVLRINAARNLRVRMVAKSPKRNMGGHGHAEVKYEGIDAVVRKYLPENHHVALGIMGGYFGLYLLSKIFSMGKKKAPVAAVAPAILTEGGIPSSDSAEFGEWLAQNGNIEKLLASL